MKICASAVSGNLDAQIDLKFDRCSYFLILDSVTMKFCDNSNMAYGVMDGAGIQAT